MNFIEFFLTLCFTVLLVSTSEAWEEDDSVQGENGLQDNSWTEDTRGALERALKLRRFDDSSEVPVREFSSLSRPFPSRFSSFMLRRLLTKRYMGMEIPEFITKSDGSGGAGGTPQRGMKQKLVSSG